jgi:hypothetical protein
MHAMLLDLNKKVDKLLNREPASASNTTTSTVNILEKFKIIYPIKTEEPLRTFEEFIASEEHFSALAILRLFYT